MPDAPWGAGLHGERTTLAWTRTSLSLAVVSLLLTRLTAGSGAVALVTGLTGLVLAELLVIAQAGRHRRSDAAARAGRLRPACGAAAGLTSVTVVLAAVALALVVSRAA